MKKYSNSHQKRKLRSIPPHLKYQDTMKMQTFTHITGARWIKYILQWLGVLLFFMTHTKGLAGDPQEPIKHIEALKKMNSDLEFYSADGGYDSFLNHSDIWYHLNAKPIISYASDVINKEREEERMNHWVNKKRKLGGDIHAPMDNKLKFRYEIGRKEQVGMYLRNQNIRDESFNDQYKREPNVKSRMDTLKVQ